jgi:hypothetical protein
MARGLHLLDEIRIGGIRDLLHERIIHIAQEGLHRGLGGAAAEQIHRMGCSLVADNEGNLIARDGDADGLVDLLDAVEIDDLAGTGIIAIRGCDGESRGNEAQSEGERAEQNPAEGRDSWGHS